MGRDSSSGFGGGFDFLQQQHPMMRMKRPTPATHPITIPAIAPVLSTSLRIASTPNIVIYDSGVGHLEEISDGPMTPIVKAVRVMLLQPRLPQTRLPKSTRKTTIFWVIEMPSDSEKALK
jgi:hypothetical protein